MASRASRVLRRCRTPQCVAKVAALQADRNQGGRGPGDTRGGLEGLLCPQGDGAWDQRCVRLLWEKRVTGSPPTPPTDLARVIEEIDLAIEYANARYESDVLPNVRAPRQRQEQKAAEAAQSQVGLDELAAKFAKPDRDT